MYYVCNTPDPMEVPSGNPIFYLTEREAIDEALRYAQQAPSSLSWYVHKIGLSTVTFRASSVITIDSEVLNGTPGPN
jgi:hypothetical protein